MSTKATIILTTENEHWHEELCAKYNYEIDCEDDRCLVLEFDNQHLLMVEDDGTFAVAIKPESELGKALRSKLKV